MRTEIDTSTTPAAASKLPPTGKSLASPTDDHLPAVAHQSPATADKSAVSPHRQSQAMVGAWGIDLFGADRVQPADVGSDMRAHISAVHAGDTRPIEAALIGQAEVLASMFTSLQLRALRANDTERFRVLMTLALKAQAQSRATYETVADVRNPRQVLIARQANIAQQQMVSLGGARDGSHRPARTETNTNAPIELLEEPHEYSLDAGTARPPVGADSRATAVGTVDRTTDTRGESRRVKKRVQGQPPTEDARAGAGRQARDQGRP